MTASTVRRGCGLVVLMGDTFRALTWDAGPEGLPVVFNKLVICRPSDGWWEGVIAPGYAEGRLRDRVFHVISLVKRIEKEM